MAWTFNQLLALETEVNTGQTTKVTSSMTAASGTLAILACYTRGTMAAAPTCAWTTGGAWTLIDYQDDGGTGQIMFFAVDAGAGKTDSVTLTRSGSDTFDQTIFYAFELSGWDDSGTVTNAIVQTEKRTQAAGGIGAWNLDDFASAPTTSGNYLVAAFGQRGSGIYPGTPRTNWTERADGGVASNCSLEVQTRDGTDTTGSITWSPASAAYPAGIAFEIAAASATAVPDIELTITYA